MRHSTLRRIRTVALAVGAGICLFMGTGADALVPLSDAVLGETAAATGIRLTLEDLAINHRADEMTFIAHENNDSLGRAPGVYGSLGLGNLQAALRLNGTLELEAKPFAFAPQSYYAKDVWKKDGVEHVSKVHALDKTPEFNGQGRQVVVLEALEDSDTPFLTIGSVEGQLQAKYGAESYALGDLGVSNVKLLDQRAILYAMPTIPVDTATPDGPLYCSGEGLAMELGLRLSVDSVKIDSCGNENLTFLEMKGVHLRESFGRLAAVYDHLGNFKENTNRDAMYASSTGDSGGYQPGDAAALETAHNTMTQGWENPDPATLQNEGKMYGGRFMIGNLRQVGFNDYVAGNNGIAFHENHANQLTDPLKDNGWDNQTYSLVPINYVPEKDRVVSAKIVERPMTLSFKKRTSEESPDQSTCMVLNMPLHGSIRVEEVLGYNSGGDDTYLGGNSMGPLIVEGLRAPKIYIEFPGRNTTYRLQTAVNESLTEPNPHDYTYRSGRLPVAQATIPETQKEYNAMGRGVEWFMDQLGPDPGPNGVPAPVDSGWAQYRTQLNGKGFWQIREPYPISTDYKLYRVN